MPTTKPLRRLSSFPMQMFVLREDDGNEHIIVQNYRKGGGPGFKVYTLQPGTNAALARRLDPKAEWLGDVTKTLPEWLQLPLPPRKRRRARKLNKRRAK